MVRGRYGEALPLEVEDSILGLQLDVLARSDVEEEPEVDPVDFAIGFVVAKLLLPVRDILESVVGPVGVAAAVPLRIDSSAGPFAFAAIGPLLVGDFGGADVLPFLFQFAVDRVQVAAADEESVAGVLDVESGTEGTDRSLIEAGEVFATVDAILLDRIGEPGLDLASALVGGWGWSAA